MKKRLIDLGSQETYANAVIAIRPVLDPLLPVAAGGFPVITSIPFNTNARACARVEPNGCEICFQL